MDKKQTILIVDDTPENIDVLKGLIKREYKVRVALNGEDALKLVRSDNPPDLILLDIMMPGMDGYEVCRRLKNNNSTKEIPVIFITAKGDYKDEKMGLEIGAVDYITKPFNPAIVVARVKTHLSLADALKKLAEQNENLSEKVEIETKKRQQKEQLLIQQSKMAAMGEMIGLIAHQWRQPLNAINIIVQEILDAYEYGEMNETLLKESISDTLKQTAFMSDTIEDFRNFLKPSKEKMEFSIYSAIVDTVRLLEKQVAKTGIEIVMECIVGATTKLTHLPVANKSDSCCLCGLDHKISGYPNEFKQVILNLLTNSRDAIIKRKESGGFREDEEGRIAIKLGTSNEGYVIRIRDNGGGISEEIEDKIFEPYFSTKGDEGTGIGLHMSRTIIEGNMSGRLFTEKIENGVEFVIELSPS